MSDAFEIRLDRDEYAPGETVGGSAVVRDGGSARTVEAFLEFLETTRDYSYVARSVPAGAIGGGELRPGQVLELSLPLPHDALPSLAIEGRGELQWRVHVRLERPGFDAHAYRTIRVA